MLEAIAKDAPDIVEAHVQLATAYNRLEAKRRCGPGEGDRRSAECRGAGEAERRHRSGTGRRDDAASEPASLAAVMRVALLRGSAALLGATAHGRQAPAPAPGRRPSRRRARPAAPRRAGRIRSTGESRPPRRAQAEQWEDAIDLYAKAVKLRPTYVEGYWYQGTAYYTLDKFTECRDAFRAVARLAPKNGAAFAFLGLCEFGLKDYDRSLQHLLQSRILGVGDTQDLGSVARYHAAVLMTRMRAVRAGAGDARRVRERRGRQPARDRGDGHRHAAHADAAGRGAAGPPRDGADGRPRAAT